MPVVYITPTITDNNDYTNGIGYSTTNKRMWSAFQFTIPSYVSGISSIGISFKYNCLYNNGASSETFGFVPDWVSNYTSYGLDLSGNNTRITYKVVGGFKVGNEDSWVGTSFTDSLPRSGTYKIYIGNAAATATSYEVTDARIEITCNSTSLYIMYSPNGASGSSQIEYKEYNSVVTIPGSLYTQPSSTSETVSGGFTVSYDANGGSSPPEITLSTKTQTTSHPFKYWRTWVDESRGTVYRPGDTYTMTASLSLFSIWDTVVTETQDPITLSSDVPTRPGYKFVCWNTLSNGSGTPYVPGATIRDASSDIILYAIWEVQNIVYIKYNGVWVPALCYVRYNDVWMSAMPYVKTPNGWKGSTA